MRQVKLFKNQNDALFGFDIDSGECCFGQGGHIDFNSKQINESKIAKKRSQGYEYFGDCKVDEHGGIRSNPVKKKIFIEVGEPGEGFYKYDDMGGIF
jgi:hypothetical protein